MTGLLLLGVVSAATLSVPADYGLQEAIEAAQDGDQVAVGPGTYTGHFDFLGKDIRVYSTDGAALTVLDGENAPSSTVVWAVSGEPLSATLQGFTITRGQGSEMIWDMGNGWLGAGLLVRKSSLTVVECVFTRSSARRSGQSAGGGIAVTSGQLVVQDSEFYDNLGFYAGGGILAIRSTVLVQDSLFHHNISRRGGALAAFQRSDVTLVGNTWSQNRAGWGGAVFVKDSTLQASSELLQDNESWRNGGAIAIENSVVTLSEVELLDNTAQDDGGHIYLAQGGALQVMASWLGGGLARAGGAIFQRGASSTLELRGVVLAENQALVQGGDLWLAQGSAHLAQLTSYAPKLPEGGLGAMLFAAADVVVSVTNTILFGGSGGSAVEVDGAEVIWRRGLFFGFDGEQGDFEQHSSLFVDPLLVSTSPGALDPRLVEGSPAIDAGALGSLDEDGSAADLGATGGLSPWRP